MAVVSNEISHAYENKYQNKITLIKGRNLTSKLLFITTTSAFAESSIYNRLYYEDKNISIENTKGYQKKPKYVVAQSLGYTQGSGSFHIPEKLYIEIIKFLHSKDINAERRWGNGPSRKMRLIDKAFSLLGLKNGVYHNIKREFFILW